MAIFGFVVLLALSIFALGAALVMLAGIKAFGGKWSDRIVFIVLLSLAAAGFCLAYKNSPIAVSIVERTNQ